MTYQILFLGTPWNEKGIKYMLQNIPDVTMVKKNELDMKNPLLILYFGNSDADAVLEDDDKSLIEYAVRHRMIQPITKVAEDFKTMIPNEIKSINGFFMKEDGVTDIVRLNNLIASYFGMLDSNKKVFISYCRDDIEPLAQQLFDELIKRKYHPFLDSYSIEAGVDFQEYLLHELVDSEIIILLDTPNFNSRPYCMEEFNIANQEKIPVLDIRFKIDPKTNQHRFCDFWETDLSCEEAVKDNSLVGKILLRMESCRARAFHFKRQYILEEFNAQCQKFNQTVSEQGGFLRCDQTHECFYPLTRIPSSADIHKVYEIFGTTPFFSSYTKQILYNGNYCRPDVQKKLQWLNEHLPIHTYNITK